MDFPEVVESIDTPTKKRKLKEEVRHHVLFKGFF
jgi:hypothetical protein